MSNSVQYFIFILSGTYFVCLSWHRSSFKKLLINYVTTNILNFVTSLKFKRKKLSSNKICDYDMKMNNLKILHRSLVAVFDHEDLFYDYIKKTTLTRSTALTSSRKHCNDYKLPTTTFILYNVRNPYNIHESRCYQDFSFKEIFYLLLKFLKSWSWKINFFLNRLNKII